MITYSTPKQHYNKTNLENGDQSEKPRNMYKYMVIIMHVDQ